MESHRFLGRRALNLDQESCKFQGSMQHHNHPAWFSVALRSMPMPDCRYRLIVIALMSSISASVAGDANTLQPLTTPRISVVTPGDGLANAPANTPQLPNLLSGYSVRPTWNVAGVDYAVGYASGTILKTPSTISMAGVSVDSANHIINVSGSNVTLSGYD
ncbi:hypothetical protein, partial [Bradyrhizobium sp. SBR1B]|uniref:hypothetical protein n=1 Tax=Bradyrhizobium sp. SBR1B TaxID=2663836 RepID=UPI001605E9DA